MHVVYASVSQSRLTLALLAPTIKGNVNLLVSPLTASLLSKNCKPPAHRTIELLRSFCINWEAMSNEPKPGSESILKFANDKGEFKRKASSFRSWITKDGSSGFPAESGRYHLYVSYACPWAHRTLVTRQLKGLEESISLNVVDYFMGEKGWRFNPDVPGATPDTLYGFDYLREVYFLAQEDYEGRFTVPVLWDKKTKTIVNNESAEILRMLNSEFNEFCGTDEQKLVDLYPENLREEIDQLNEWIYRYGVNP